MIEKDQEIGNSIHTTQEKYELLVYDWKIRTDDSLDAGCGVVNSMMF